MDCTPKCRLAKHAELILSAITKEDVAKVRAILPRVCSNFARVTDQFGRSALHLAASCGKGDILEWLVKDQAVDVELKDLESGWTALHRTVFYGYLDCTVKLIQLGSDLGCFDKESLSPLDLIRLDSPFQVTTGVQAQVVSSYETCLEDELQLKVGDVVKDIRMTDARYWSGNLNGRRGHFPKDCVKLLSEDHPLELFTWGSNTNFTLGHRDESSRHAPELLENVQVCIKEVVMCKFHSVFLSMDGKVFTCGYGRGGRLGHGNEETLLVLQEVKALQGMNCVSVAAGQDHTVAVTDDGSVYTFGLNDSHQLGHVHSPVLKQCLLPKMVQLKLWKGKDIVGAAAGRYHSVFFTRHEVYTCGLNAGQLGHPKGEKYQTVPRQVSALADKDVVISKVSCSDGATVCATDKGDIFLLNLYTCRKIISRFTDLTHLAMIGGELDMISTQEVSKKFADELAVTLLNSRGRVFQWKPKFSSMRECCWCHNRPITVRDFSIGKQLVIVSDDGEAFICHPNETKSSPVNTDSNRICRSSSISFKNTESTLAQSPPISSPLSDISKEKDESLSRSFPNTTPLSSLAKDNMKKDAILEYCLERITLIHRGQRIFTDSKSRGFAVLQVASKEGLQKIPQVSSAQMSEQLVQLLEEATCEDDIHDVEFIIKRQVIPAHGFVLASRSPKCHQLIYENKDNCAKVTDRRIQTIALHGNIDYGEVIRWLKRLYSGENVSDKELLLKDVTPTKGKNGYHGISKNKLEKKASTRTDRNTKEKKVELDYDGKHLIQDCLLADLAFLSNRDFDDFSAPTVDVDEMLQDNATSNLVERNSLDAAGVTQSTCHELKDHVRNGNKADLSRCHTYKFSRLNCPELYDVVIVSKEGTEMKCHKCILVARLEYFRSMLASGWLESSEQSKTLKLPFPAVILEIVLDFLYSGQAGRVEEITDLELLGNILIVADQLLIWRLREICEAVIANLVTLRNVAEVLEFSLLYNANQLRDVCTEYICNNLGSLMEARTLDVLGDEALGEISKAYRNMIPGMAWRMITSLDLHASIPVDSPEPSHTKRRRSTGRKKSSRSESEQDVAISETVQEESGAEQVHRAASVQETEEVFVLNIEECETAAVDKNGEVDGSLESTRLDDQETQEHQGNVTQQTGDAGLWYRKHSAELAKSKKKKGRDKKKPPGKSVEDSEGEPTSQKDKATTKKVPSPEKPAWSKPSVSSPPAASLKDIIEQEQSQASSVVNCVNEKVLSPSKGTGDKHPPAQSLSTSPQGRALRWNSGGRQSQKQRKRSKSNPLDESGDRRESPEGNTSDLADTRKEEKRPIAWGGVNKDPVSVQSLRDLMQEEKQRTTIPTPTPTPRIPVAPGKSGSTRKKLNWRPQPVFSNSDPDEEEAVDTDHERESSVPALSPLKSAWKSNHVACSPPSSSVAFSAILESQELENTNLNKFSRKPFHLTQLEERAMDELLQYYGGKDNACEFVTVERIPSTAATPVWKKERSPSVTSN